MDATIQSLEQYKVAYEVRRLSVGDFLWICRDTRDASVELVLPHIVERKRMDDLASSIKDGRFHEQKFRLSDCGLANKIYLIESRGSNAHVGLPLQNLLQAATNTQVHSKFSIKFTDSINDSMFYLSVMTNSLIKMFKVFRPIHLAICLENTFKLNFLLFAGQGFEHRNAGRTGKIAKNLLQ